MLSLFSLILLFQLYKSSLITQRENLNPVIGIVAQPTTAESSEFKKLGKYYLSAAYVKWIEQSGAQVVPIISGLEEKELKKIFNSVNGLLFPGGDIDLSRSDYFQTTKLLLNWAVEANEKTDYFPVWATCQGFEELGKWKNDTILQKFHAENQSLPLIFEPTARRSRMFGEKSMSEEIFNAFRHNSITENLHSLGISPKSYYSDPQVSNFFELLSTSIDRKGETFISSWEAKRYPIYGTQFHPERPQFEWLDQYVNHSPISIQANAALSFFFVNEARKSTHHFPTEQTLHEKLIFNFKPWFVANFSYYDEVVYFFN